MTEPELITPADVTIEQLLARLFATQVQIQSEMQTTRQLVEEDRKLTVKTRGELGKHLHSTEEQVGFVLYQVIEVVNAMRKEVSMNRDAIGALRLNVIALEQHIIALHTSSLVAD